MEQLLITKASIGDAELIHTMQVESFQPLLDKYKDFGTNPANEGIERTIERLNQKQTDYYLISYQTNPVGAIRIAKRDNHRYRLSPIFILPEYQGRGIAKATIQIVEEIYTDWLVWELDTILEECKLCGLYESLGYITTGKITAINDNMRIVFYEKHKV
ncbi:GNAT family N-acetyltransferase [Sporosarcina limicola]|uniref:GNAT superfamily N-acetyltransferase n=1 Tax=Sporosarcina limicola TaxID=34101 RepID=A0A927MGC9_9BACL|nr:GNAT family N-acetyltransferase [Sporosarcina limicola]MBE1554209.1 GNAT superfamily N-acetyltransferase [Sporosarcina limicola]